MTNFSVKTQSEKKKIQDPSHSPFLYNKVRIYPENSAIIMKDLHTTLLNYLRKIESFHTHFRLFIKSKSDLYKTELYCSYIL